MLDYNEDPKVIALKRRTFQRTVESIRSSLGELDDVMKASLLTELSMHLHAWSDEIVARIKTEAGEPHA
jgi:hypothetical protein